ncbi:unnamed protein product [Microthlaspi erraticum]|uniref:Uncharacterized protein n=1 Tax=Microthlaspi erraticum TaxID=1685480 RepID=A0A6D2IL69_9BRAS|nr:unnamed protein product [Microthlaspi erraticum]CAA7058740.1 unnamed protein product [Microthlaspi erraticum]
MAGGKPDQGNTHYTKSNNMYSMGTSRQKLQVFYMWYNVSGVKDGGLYGLKGIIYNSETSLISNSRIWTWGICYGTFNFGSKNCLCALWNMSTEKEIKQLIF